MSVSLETLALAKKYTDEHSSAPSDEQIANAVNEYLTENPVEPGATIEQAGQIEQNKQDIINIKNKLIWEE